MYRRQIKFWALLWACGITAGCVGVQIHDSTQVQVIALAKNELSQYHLAFLTPSTPTGQEEDKQALALGFSEVLRAQRPEICYVSLPETLGVINRANLSDAYRDMYDEYRNTGILKKEVLAKIAEQLHVRYFLQLKLANFKQDSSSRFGFFGFRLVDTKFANIRLFVQIWDAQTGTIAFEAIQELNYADDTSEERPVSFATIVEETARRVITKLP
ncbi:MAG: hypothetical protein HY080_14550 [Gammaproteobacteria bacterium]|nr:hypothetical protein [Gammaproteobacteria bacterium]